MTTILALAMPQPPTGERLAKRYVSTAILPQDDGSFLLTLTPCGFNTGFVRRLYFTSARMAEEASVPAALRYSEELLRQVKT